MIERRRILGGIGGSLGLAATGVSSRIIAAEPPFLTPGLPSGTIDTAVLDQLPGKRPLIKLSYRPPNYETPVSYFTSPITPNDAFFVRYHLGVIPEVSDYKDWKLKIGGEGASSPFEVSLATLTTDFEPVEITAVCQCSGNRRGLSNPHVAGVQWGSGAMGNAVWKGVRLKDLLAKAGIAKETVEFVLNGADGPVLDKTPDYIKSIPVSKGLDETTIVAYAMNGQPLPLYNGFPARLVIPGWTATYWMKHLVSIEAVTKPYTGFWMKSAYRIPAGKFPVIQRFTSQATEVNEPITEMVVNSVVVSPVDGFETKRGQPVEAKGLAWDGGYGISRVQVSVDGGKTWVEAALGPDTGRFSFRPWTFTFTPDKPGAVMIMVKASNAAGQTQAERLIFNPAGYHNNVVRPVAITVT